MTALLAYYFYVDLPHHVNDWKDLPKKFLAIGFHISYNQEI